MPDAAGLGTFAEYVLQLLPRLLIYPGGLFALACAAVLQGVLPRLARHDPPSAAEGEGWAVPALALAWAGWALLPLPGAPSPAGAPDLLTPLGLLVGAGLLLRARLPATGAREILGRPLLLIAPLLALVGAGTSGLLAGGTAPPGTVPRALAALAYVVGYCVCYGAPGAAPWQRRGPLVLRAAGWMEWMGWLGAGAALGPAARATGAAPVWTGPVLMAGLIGAAAGILALGPARSIGARGAAWGWGALGVALLGLLLEWP